MPLPIDYLERVYAGVLGKIIGVYLGRPFEGWNCDKILAELGEINYYVHERRGVPLVVTDDDISGTFTFIRAMEDYAAGRKIAAEQIGKTWLNYLIENRTVLWWGGMGNSTEHTAYLRLKHGIAAPASGSIQTNSNVVAEQIGAQIFIDGWAMIAPGDPELATALARQAASVSHDGEAIYGAQVVTAIESMAFVENDINNLLDTAVTFIPKDSVIYRMIADLRNWRGKEPDWLKARELLDRDYGYHKYGGNCHIVPNHGLVILALLWGENSFQKSLMIANTCGWDTDCNSGNVGCIMGIRNGLAGLDAGPDYRTPVADRMLLPTADGGSCITDAVAQSYRLANIGRALAGEPPLPRPNGARFHFALPGSVQGFMLEDSPESRGTATLANTGRGLEIHYHHVAPGRPCRIATSTFLSPEMAKMPNYGVVACPTIYPGQIVRARLLQDRAPAAAASTVDERVLGDRIRYAYAAGQVASPVNCRPYIRVYDDKDQLRTIHGPLFEPSAALAASLDETEAGASHALESRVADTADRRPADRRDRRRDQRPSAGRRHASPPIPHLGRRAQYHARPA